MSCDQDGFWKSRLCLMLLVISSMHWAVNAVLWMACCSSWTSSTKVKVGKIEGKATLVTALNALEPVGSFSKLNH